MMTDLWLQAWRWLCNQRRHAPDNTDIWHLMCSVDLSDARGKRAGSVATMKGKNKTNEEKSHRTDRDTAATGLGRGGGRHIVSLPRNIIGQVHTVRSPRNSDVPGPSQSIVRVR